MNQFVTDVRTMRDRGECFAADRSIYIARAPGRLDLMGGNDDYTGGMVFEATIREATWAAAQQRSDQSIVLVNPQMIGHGWLGRVEFDRAKMKDDERVRALVGRDDRIRWTAYVLGVFHWLGRAYPELVQAGMTVFICSDVPLNKGVSSSAAVEVAVMKAAAKAYGIELSGIDLAEACQWVENVIAQSACGIMDQIAIVLGDEDHVLPLLCQPCIPQPLVRLPPGLTCWGIDSGVRHEVSGVAYEAARAAAFMGYKMICDSQGIAVTPDAQARIPRYTDPRYGGYLANLSVSRFRALEELLPVAMSGSEYLRSGQVHVDPFTQVRSEVQYSVRACTRYAVEEHLRVCLFVSLVRGLNDAHVLDDPFDDPLGNAVLLGELMYLSHYAYSDTGLGCAETDLLVELARRRGPERGIFGAKITGGGAGGTVAVLGRSEAEDEFQEIVEAYRAQTGIDPYVFYGSSMGADRFGVVAVEPQR
jgi:L-arabinokinase